MEDKRKLTRQQRVDIASRLLSGILAARGDYDEDKVIDKVMKWTDKLAARLEEE